MYLKEFQPKQYNDIVTMARSAVQKFKDNGSTSTDSADKVAVQVTTSPKGATIYVDGTQVSKKTPNKLSLAPGDYEIQLKLEGYNPLTRKITVEKDTPLAVNETLQK